MKIELTGEHPGFIIRHKGRWRSRVILDREQLRSGALAFTCVVEDCMFAVHRRANLHSFGRSSQLSRRDQNSLADCEGLIRGLHFRLSELYLDAIS